MFDNTEFQNHDEELIREKLVDISSASLEKYFCNNCKTTFSTSIHNKTDRCVFCGGTNIDKSDNVEKRNLYYIPFFKTMDDVVQDYKKKVSLNPLIPFVFKKKATIQSIKKVFLPAYLANANVKGNLSILAGDKNQIIQDKKKVVETKKYDVKMNVNFDYKNVLLNLYSKINLATFTNVCEYDYQNVKELDFNLINDSYYIIGDIPIEDVANNGRENIKKSSLKVVRDSVQHALKKMNKDGTVIQFDNTKELLIPAYLLNVRYGKKDYLYIMNGENGVSTMELVFGKLEIIIFSILIFAIIFLLSFLVAYFL